MRVGDKLLTVDSFHKRLGLKSEIFVDKIEKGKYYEISHIRRDIESHNMNAWDIKELEKPGKIVSIVWIGDINYFYTEERFSGYYLWDYFYTPKELRKLKLNNINEL